MINIKMIRKIYPEYMHGVVPDVLEAAPSPREMGEVP